MINRLIEWSVTNRLAVAVAALVIAIWCANDLRNMALDALPDLSDTQVIIRTSLPGQNPTVIEDQVTWPLSQALLAVPGAKNVRGYSFPGDSFVYVLFEEGTDRYWARSRVVEYLSQAKATLPAGAEPILGPDANGVGWVYQYALIDRSGQHDLSDLRSLQDWYMRQALQSVTGVSEVASVGGMVKQYQVELDVGRMRAHELNLQVIRQAIVDNNAEVSGSVIELGEAEYMVRGRGYLSGVEDIKEIPYLFKREANVPLQVQDFARVSLGPEQRRGVAELNGEGEVAGGVVIMRAGENTLRTVAAVKKRIEELKQGLPEGVEVVEVYNRASLIERVLTTLGERLLEEFLVVILVALVFLRSLRAGMVVLFTLPVAVLIAMQLMRWQGISANLMSLGGIAIAIGAMVDAVVVMVENIHKKLEYNNGTTNRLALIVEALKEVSRPLFFALLVVSLGFLPVFALEAQEGRLFTPLAWTKTWAMAAATVLSVSLVPALAALFIRGRVRAEDDIAFNRCLQKGYRRSLTWVLDHPRMALSGALLLLALSVFPLMQLKTEFMPPLDEGDLLYMPSAQPGVSVGRIAQLVQQTNKMIKEVPEVEQVFGKAGRADSATDPAPLSMIETWIKLKPREQWRPGVDRQHIVNELDAKVQVPGLVNSWLMPISARLAMLETGVKTPLGLRVEGPELAGIQDITVRAEAILSKLPGQRGVYAERPQQGRYIDVEVDRRASAFHGLSVKEVQDVISLAVGGENIAQTIEGRERYPINLRYPRHVRSSPKQLESLPVFLATGEQIRLGDVAEVSVVHGPAVIRSENANLSGWVHINLDGTGATEWVAMANRALHQQLHLPAGYSLAWAGQYQYLERAKARLTLLVPLAILLSFVILSVALKSNARALLILASLPFAVAGGLWLLWALGHAVSVAVVVGFIALGGIAIEFAMVMLVWLDRAVERLQPQTAEGIRAAVLEGAAGRLRPKTMTLVILLGGLLPVLLGSGSGSEMMQRIAAPMVGGMITAPLISLYLVPLLYSMHQQKSQPKPDNY
ncbi:MAG: efflux RND transporter permease subunit [Granulosicoccaceae bacterium]